MTLGFYPIGIGANFTSALDTRPHIGVMRPAGSHNRPAARETWKTFLILSPARQAFFAGPSTWSVTALGAAPDIIKIDAAAPTVSPSTNPGAPDGTTAAQFRAIQA